jgi:fructokinase
MLSVSQKSALHLLGAIEAGGTKFNCALADMNKNVVLQTTFPTTTPEKTLANVRDFFNEGLTTHNAQLAALGIASFGPVDLNPDSPSYGFITTTPKPHWSNTDICGYFRNEFNAPIAFETDVNSAAWAELITGAAQGCRHFIYVTIGTGIGAGIVTNGNLLQGISHPEVGHMVIPHNRIQDSFKGLCPFHHDCLEGLASGIAIERRWGVSGKELSDDHAAWELEASYLAAMCINLTHCFSPEKIVLGGGVMEKKILFPLIQAQFSSLIKGYAHPRILKAVSEYIVPTALSGKAGIIGALDLASRKLRQKSL